MPEYEEHKKKDNSRENVRPAEPSMLKAHFAFLILPVFALFLLVFGISFALYGKNSNSSPEELDNPEESVPPDLLETFTWLPYKVKKGDTVSQIALDFSISMDAVIASNGITNARALREGQMLQIPNMDGIPYTVKNGDSLLEIAQSMDVPIEAILNANGMQNDLIYNGMTLFIPGAKMNREELKLAIGELFIYPVRGARLTSPFGWRNDPFGSEARRHHNALDLAAPQGTAVVAAMDGAVTSQGYDETYGNFIILSHPGSFQTMYAHLDTALVQRGDQVGQGIKIGTVGNTGYSTGYHLHFSIFKNQRAINPLNYLNS